MPVIHDFPQRQDCRLILASASPRRQELLKLCGTPFCVVTAEVDEGAAICRMQENHKNLPFDRLAEHIVMGLASEKAAAVLSLHPETVVIGADTIVTVGESILGKPSSPEEAFQMLKELCGKRHQVLTGVSIKSRGREDTFFSRSFVQFYPWDSLTEDVVRRYVDTGSPMDKAGAYGIQDMGALLVQEIEGDYYTIMGLPLAEIYRRLEVFL